MVTVVTVAGRAILPWSTLIPTALACAVTGQP